jgi:cyclopropane fatty-acyl-phospholipid synthase-like methyltransferase
MKEPAFEKILRRLRLNRISKCIENNDRVLDVGCGWQALALRYFSSRIKEGVGIDFKVEQKDVPLNISLLAERFDEKWPSSEKGFDKVLMLAVLEHIEPERVGFVLKNIRGALKPGGKLILTVPTPRGKPVLEFLSYKLGVVNPEEIRDHKKYYDRSLLQEVMRENGFTLSQYKTFQLGMNSFGVATPL